MINKFTVPMKAEEFRASVTGISEICTKFKIDVFRSSAANGSVDDYKVRTFLGSVNSFVRSWESYGKELQKAIQNSNPDKMDTAYSVEYDRVKPFIFAAYDYASVLQFTDGVVRGAKNTDITKDSKYADFFAITCRNAFKDRPADAGMMVNEVMTFNIQKADDKEKALFKSIKNKNMFDNNDRIEIYKSIEKSVEYLTDVILNPTSKEYTYFNGQMRASACNWIIEYVKTTMIAFACRAYAITVYARDFVDPRTTTKDECVTEAADAVALSEITYMKDIDDSIIFDPFNYDDYLEKVTEWLMSFTTVGNIPTLKAIRDTWHSDNELAKLAAENKVYAKLSLNSLYNFIFDSNMSESIIRAFYDDNINDAAPEKVLRNLKDFITSKNLGTGNSTSPLLELIEVIKNITPVNSKGERDDTVAGYEQLACDMIYAYTLFAYKITDIYRRLSNSVIDIGNQKNTLTLKYMNDMRFILSEIYKTAGVAVLSKCRDIEMKINDLRRANFKSAIEEISIKIPGTLKSDYDSNINTMSAIPDTNRSFVEAADVISLMSEMDRLNMYDEYVKTIPGMADDWYYSEAFSFQDIINKILALLQGIKKKWDEFFTNQQFKAAVNWCQKNKDALTSATFNGSIQCFDYKYNKGTHLDKLIAAITNCDLGKATKEGGLEEYRKTLYEGIDDRLYSSTYGASKDWNPKAFQNWVLFGNPSAGDIPAGEKVVDKTLVEKWLNDVSASMTTYEECKKMNDDITAAMQSLKNKVVSLKPDQQTEQPPSVSDNQTEEEKKKGEEAQKKHEQDTAMYTASQNVLNTTQQAINDLYNPMIPIITGMLRTEYKYIQQAWGMRVNSQQQANPTT